MTPRLAVRGWWSSRGLNELVAAHVAARPPRRPERMPRARWRRLHRRPRLVELVTRKAYCAAWIERMSRGVSCG